MPTVKPMRYAHSDGHTDVCFDDSGRYILTCGSDGDVRIWDGIDDDDAISHRCGDKVFAIAYKENRYFTATDTNTVQAYTFPDGTPDGILTRFTAPANHLVLNKSGSTLVAGSSDFAINVVDVSNCSYKSCQGHEAPVLSVALDPREEFLASSSCDGTVRVWRLSDRTQVSSLYLIPKCSDPSLSKTVCRMCWEQKEGKLLYVPAQKGIHVYDRDTWTKTSNFTDPVITEYVSVLALSPDGRYLAAGCYDGWICIFDTKTKKCVDKHRNEKGLSVTSLVWNPKDNMELVFCDNQGQLGLLSDIETEGKGLEEEKAEVSSKVPAGVFDDEDDDFLIQATADDNEPEDSDIDADTGTKFARPAVLSDDDADSLAGFHKPDDDASSVTSEKSEPPKPDIRVEGYKPTPMQRPFQPGSTPEHLSSRFMVWNSVGIIKQYNSEEENSIDIEFHDTSVHHAMHITNTSNFTMADLSAEAVLLASEGESDSPSKLTCMHFSTWDNNKEWSTTMPEDEDIQCVALGEGWVAVATDTRNVRLMSITGVQREIFSIPGPVVCMSGHGGQLMVIYHRAMGIPGDQCLGVTLLDVKEWRREISEEPLPLSPKSTLTWTGFSAEGTPFCMDSAGVVRMLNRQAGKTWIQVANTRDHAKGKSDHYWIVGINESPQQLRGIPCKGARYPATLPRPAMTVLPFQVPLCELNTEKSQYEEMLWRTKLMTGHFDIWTRQGYEFEESLKTEAQKPAQEALMKLFALSARSEREYRALEVCEMMTDQHTLQLAIKYSSRMRYIQLAQRISEMAVRKAEEEETKAYSQRYRAPDKSYEEVATPNVRYTSYARQAHTEEGQQDEEVEVEEMQTEEVETEEEDEMPSGPMLAIKSKEEKAEKQANPFKIRSNPFKVSTPHPASGLTKGTQVFDSLTKKKEKPTLTLVGASKSLKKSSQPKIFLKKKQESTPAPAQTATLQKPKSGFDLWLEENIQRLKESKPEADDDDFNKYAAEQFRAQPKEERQGWVKRAKSQTEKSKENEDTESKASDNTENKKRKRDDADAEEEAVKKLKDCSDSDLKKKPLSQSTNSKLASFAFSKEES